MRRPRLTSWVSGLATFLVAALLATPLWDFWHYRGLRTGPGPGFAVGLILPPASPQRPALPAALVSSSPAPPPETTSPSSATSSGRPAPGSSAAPRASSDSMEPGAGSGPPSGAAGAGGTHPATAPASGPQPAEEAARAGHAGSASGKAEAAKDHGKTAPRAAAHAKEAAPRKEPPAGSPGAESPVAPAGWLLSLPAPSTNEVTQVPPDPQSGLPPPKPLEPVPGQNDPAVVPQALPVLTLVSPADSVAIGQDVTVSIRLSGAQDVTSLPFHLMFDPAVLQFVSAANGTALSGLQPVLLASVNASRPGDLAVGLSFIEAGGAFNGSGTVLDLRFRALAAGVSTLTFDRASIRGRISQAVDGQFENGSISVR